MNAVTVPHTSTPRWDRIPSLDGLRFFSILLVVLGHAKDSPGLPPLLHFATHDANIGVRIFFVISGYLITSLLLRERASSGTISMRDFYIKRAYRILPASVLAILGIALIFGAARGDVLRSLFFIQNYSAYGSNNLEHFWSLSVEEQFYLLWPFLLRRYYQKRFLLVNVGIFSAIIIRPLALYHTHSAFGWFPCVEDSIAVGCLLAMCKPEDLRTFRIWTDRLIIPIWIGLLILMNFNYPPGVQPFIIQTLVNVLIVCAIDNAIRKEYRILNWGPVMWIGTLSFSLYLWHMPFFPEVPTNRWYTYFPCAIVLSLLAAIASFYLVEQPALRHRHKALRLYGGGRFRIKPETIEISR